MAGLILDRREASGHRQRIVERALAVLELADMKTDHGRKEEAAVLYKKGLECLGSVMTLLRSNDGDSREDATDSAALIERLKVGEGVGSKYFVSQFYLQGKTAHLSRKICSNFQHSSKHASTAAASGPI